MSTHTLRRDIVTGPIVTEEEREAAISQGMAAASIFDNPYWPNYPKPSTDKDEILARLWVQGYVATAARSHPS